MNKQQIRGVSMVETCVAGAILAILTSLAAPAFVGAIERRAVQGAVDEFRTDVELARSLAAARSSTISISFPSTSGAQSCYIVHTGNRGDCACDGSGQPFCTAGAEPLRTVHLPGSGRVHLSSNVAGMAFSQGTVAPAGSVTFAGVRGTTVRAVVSSVGRIRNCAPMAATLGHSKC